MILEKGQKLLFIGDSITDCDRSKPEGEGLFHAIGRGYVSLVDGLLQSTYPELGIRVVNKGTSGNTVRDLKARWQEDVILQKPDWLSIMIGINDVWRQYDTPFITDYHVYIDEYEETLRSLIIETKQTVPNIILMTPFYIEPNLNDAMRATMDQYGAVVKRLGVELSLPVVDTQAAFEGVLQHLYPATLAWDRVHPTPAGHLLLAKAFLKEVGFVWDR
ncbi:MAG: SGNH/GDSL hydrolase family protein [Candidatus Pristimantibacillus lignocellulolyticus]|uniref:SGNH/GDSL hydrolase family protein n=1 Tax=Candidatus Pristimantibacillus lignocellulolyticus TaxID=2994561 RepID=A0A9J6ZJR3_9BACL|nr:MAG: SGNH/GDSL hydrolase family protein [Candidatus Pristimantibacillus lignocellulolyticus]